MAVGIDRNAWQDILAFESHDSKVTAEYSVNDCKCNKLNALSINLGLSFPFL